MNPMLARLALAGILAVAEKNDKRTPEQRAEDAGYDAGRNKPNTTNCHFSHFATPEQTRAWSAGRSAAMPSAKPGKRSSRLPRTVKWR